MKIAKAIAFIISIWLIVLTRLQLVSASVIIQDGVPVVTDEPKDIWALAGNSDNAWNSMYTLIGTLVSGITGLISIIMVGVFAWKAFELAKSSSNPADRQKAIQGLIYTMVAFVILGSISLFVGIFYGLLK